MIRIKIISRKLKLIKNPKIDKKTESFKYPRISLKPKTYVRGDIRLSNGLYRNLEEKEEYFRKSLERKLP